jgi:hypothetical protein
LRELCRTEDSRTSDFWEIFNPNPVQVGGFADSDWEGFLVPLKQAGLTIDGSAQTELKNWAGGVPILAVALLGELLVSSSSKATLSKAEVDDAAKQILDHGSGPLAALWEDCSFELRGDLAFLSKDNILLSEMSASRRRNLEERGFAQVSGKSLCSSCRLMAHYAHLQAPAVTDLKRYFGTEEAYNANVRSLLELRLTQVSRGSVDNELLNHVTKAVRDIEPDPWGALTHIRNVVARALTIIWGVELPPDKTLPAEWVDSWKHGRELLPWLDKCQGRLPLKDGQQCNVLRLITGTERIPRLARYITKPTYVLLDHLQSVGDLGQHRNDFSTGPITVGFAAAVLFDSIELVASLSRDMAKPAAR